MSGPGSAISLTFITSGSPWTITTVDLGTSFAEYRNVNWVEVSGDQSECVVATASLTVHAMPMNGDTTPNWSCELGDGILIGAPYASRWLRENAAGGVDLLDDTGSVLDSVAFTHPTFWLGDLRVVWTQLNSSATTYVYLEHLENPQRPINIRHRTLITTGDTIDWADTEQTVPVGWVRDTLEYFYPIVSAWDGQLAIGYGSVGFS